jgi:hypothetical protein
MMGGSSGHRKGAFSLGALLRPIPNVIAKERKSENAKGLERDGRRGA